MWKSKYKVVSLKTKVDKVIPFTNGIILPKGTSGELYGQRHFSELLVTFYDVKACSSISLLYSPKDLEMQIEIVGELEQEDDSKV